MSYDSWKTIDIDHEKQCEAREELEKHLECEECGNNDIDEFENIETDEYSTGGYDCISIKATCKLCEAGFEYCDEPDFDSMFEERRAKEHGYF